MIFRRARTGDLPAILSLASSKRREYAAYSPRFWHPAGDAVEKQRSYFADEWLDGSDRISLVADENGSVQGFIMGNIQTAPAVYDPGGTVCSIDDFAVSDRGKWDTVGRTLLDAVGTWAKEQGAVLLIVVSGRLDVPKRSMLEGRGASVASEWWIEEL